MKKTEKKTEKTIEKVEKTGIQFSDKIEKRWYLQEDTHSVSICDTLEEVLKGKFETHTFTSKIVSNRIVEKHGKPVERNYFVLFTLENGDLLLLRKNRELK
jgi:hypothetical protein